jgi:hypothetical protein
MDDIARNIKLMKESKRHTIKEADSWQIEYYLRKMFEDAIGAGKHDVGKMLRSSEGKSVIKAIQKLFTQYSLEG